MKAIYDRDLHGRSEKSAPVHTLLDGRLLFSITGNRQSSYHNLQEKLKLDMNTSAGKQRGHGELVKNVAIEKIRACMHSCAFSLC